MSAIWVMIYVCIIFLCHSVGITSDYTALVLEVLMNHPLKLQVLDEVINYLGFLLLPFPLLKKKITTVSFFKNRPVGLDVQSSFNKWFSVGFPPTEFAFIAIFCDVEFTLFCC